MDIMLCSCFGQVELEKIMEERQEIILIKIIGSLDNLNDKKLYWKEFLKCSALCRCTVT